MCQAASAKESSPDTLGLLGIQSILGNLWGTVLAVSRSESLHVRSLE